jgi:hypothetical protein
VGEEKLGAGGSDGANLCRRRSVVGTSRWNGRSLREAVEGAPSRRSRFPSLSARFEEQQMLTVHFPSSSFRTRILPLPTSYTTATHRSPPLALLSAVGALSRRILQLCRTAVCGPARLTRSFLSVDRAPSNLLHPFAPFCLNRSGPPSDLSQPVTTSTRALRAEPSTPFSALPLHEARERSKSWCRSIYVGALPSHSSVSVDLASSSPSFPPSSPPFFAPTRFRSQLDLMLRRNMQQWQ